MTTQTSDRRAAALVGFAIGDAVASPYDGWSRPPTAGTVDVVLGRSEPLPAGALTGQLLAAVRSFADGGSVGSAEPRRVSPATDGESDILPRAVAIGLAHASPARAAEISRRVAAGADAPLTAVDAAGLVAAAVALSAAAAPSPGEARDLATDLMVYAQTDTLRSTLRAVAAFHEPPAPAGANGALGEPAGSTGVLALAVLAARFLTGLQAIRWAMRTGHAPGPVAALAGAIAAARDSSSIASDRAPRIVGLDELPTVVPALAAS